MSGPALSRIANLIKVEDELVKIPTLLQQFSKEKASIDARLNNITQSQIDSISSDLKKLSSCSSKLNNVKSTVDKINSIYDESFSQVKDIETIRKMTDLNQFLIQVKSLYHDISTFKHTLDSLNTLIDEEFSLICDDITYRMDHLLHIHYSLTQVRNLKDFLELGAVKLSDDFKSIVSKVVMPMNKSFKKYDQLLKEAIISITEGLKEGNSELVLKIVSVIEFEAKEDLKFALKKNLNLLESKELPYIDYTKFRGAKRNYRKFFFDRMEESVSETFDKCVEHFSSDKILVYDNLNWLEDELVFIKDSLAPLCPSSWKIDEFIENVYYNRLHNFTMDFINSDPPAEDLLKILAYDSHYSEFILSLDSQLEHGKSKIKIKKEKKSIIGDELKKVVLEDYSSVIIKKMKEWNDNLMKQESVTFVERSSPPDTYTYHQTFDDEDMNDQLVTLEVQGDVFVLPDFTTPLTIFKEQADVAVEAGYGSILVGVIENWSECYIKRILNYKLLVEDEFDKYMSVYSNDRFLIKESKTKRFFRSKDTNQAIDLDKMTPEELDAISRRGLIEYLAALGNTIEITTDRLQDRFLPTYKDKVHSTYQGRVQEAFDNTVPASTELIAQVIRVIIDIIINDLYPALSSLFTKSWYDQGSSKPSDEYSISQKVVETICEYMEELRSYASYDIYSCTFALLLDVFISSYIRIGYENILHGSGKKIDPHETKKFKSFAEAIERDVTTFYGGLEHLFTRKDSAYLLNSLRAIEFLGYLGTCDDPMTVIPDLWENEILTSFYYCSVDYIRGICLCRKDMDKSSVNLLIENLTKIQADYHAKVSVPDNLTTTLNEFSFN